MQSVLVELETLLAALVERDLPGALVIACGDVETLHVAQVLTRLDERSDSDVFLSFTGPATTSAAFVDAVADSLEAQRAALLEQGVPEGRSGAAEPEANAVVNSRAALPESPSSSARATTTAPIADADADRRAELLGRGLPLAARDRRNAPAQRMRALIEYVLGLLPAGDHRLVWSLLPSELPRDVLKELAEPLLCGRRDRRLRLIIRDDCAAPTSYELARCWPDEQVLAYSLDLPADDAVAAAAAAAQDPEKPAEARIQALMELAYLDLGHGRLDEAEAKFRGCAQFHAAAGNASLQALALAGTADVLRARGDLPGARLSYQTAIVVAAEAQVLAVTLQIAVALADTCFALGSFADAEAYYKIADAIAGKVLRPHTMADVRESIGACRAAQGAAAEAAQVWTAAAELCRTIDYPTRLHSILERLAAHHQDIAPDRVRRRACLEEHAAIAARMQGALSC